MKPIISEFRNNLKGIEKLSEQKFLLALSGGVDSMVLCDLFLKNDLNFCIAHCNFQLRGTDSDLDEEFVINYGIKNQIETFTKKFNVKEYKETGNYSTQMAARDLRYKWFRELMNENGFDFLVTAHHLDDSLETFLINLSRGTGINGLTGIELVHNKVFRPLYNITKELILQYAIDNSIQWREDISNAGTDYVRNKIRHRISPVLKEIHPEFIKNFRQSIFQLNQEKQLINNHIKLMSEELFESSKDGYSISIEKLKRLEPLTSYLFHLFSKYGFLHPEEIQKLMNSNEGSELNTKEYRLIKNREKLILYKKTAKPTENEFVLEEEKLIQNPLTLRFSISDKRDISAKEVLDADKVYLPLRLRKPKLGEIFFPFGMNGSKKLSKFFKDEKFSKLDKENSWLLVDETDKIMYIVGCRIDERFKITEHTQKFLNIYLC